MKMLNMQHCQLNFFPAEDWFSGKNASPILLSMKTGSQTRTYKPVCQTPPKHQLDQNPSAQVVYKPSEQAIVDSERSNDRKFSFLSSETKPDYRPLAERGL